MNIMMPVDFQAYAPNQEGLGTNDARAENNQRDAITPAQNTGNTAQSQQNDTSGDPQFKQNSPRDQVSLSAEGKQASKESNNQELSEEEQKQVQELKDRDREVRVHEQAHAAVGGQYAGAPSYEYETGPDNKRYAVGGEVSIDVSEEEKPEDTVQKMQVVRAAALAPAEPSTQDLKVAAEASQKENKARAQISQNQLSGEQQNPSPNTLNQVGTNDIASQAVLAKAYASSYQTDINPSFSVKA